MLLKLTNLTLWGYGLQSPLKQPVESKIAGRGSLPGAIDPQLPAGCGWALKLGRQSTKHLCKDIIHHSRFCQVLLLQGSSNCSSSANAVIASGHDN